MIEANEKRYETFNSIRRTIDSALFLGIPEDTIRDFLSKHETLVDLLQFELKTLQHNVANELRTALSAPNDEYAVGDTGLEVDLNSERVSVPQCGRSPIEVSFDALEHSLPEFWFVCARWVGGPRADNRICPRRTRIVDPKLIEQDLSFRSSCVGFS